jgi:hypothetical protein
MTMSKFVAILLLLLLPLGGYAQQGSARVLVYFGNPTCDGTNALLKNFVKFQSDLHDLEAQNGSKDKIARVKLAMSMLTPLLVDRVSVFGAAVLAAFGSAPRISIPAIEIDGTSYPYAKVTGEGSQLKFEFNELGICAFADPVTNTVGDTEIQNAVNAVVQP